MLLLNTRVPNVLCLIVIAACGRSEKKNIPSSASVLHDLPFVRKSPENKGVIVFVHGVLGDAETTWTSGTQYWPAMLRNDPAFAGQNIYVYRYPSPVMRHSFSVDEVAENMRLVLTDDGVLQHDQLTFVSHSMGGIVTRAFILKYQKQVATKVRFLFFFATPTTGSPYARLARMISNNSQFGQMYPMDVDGYLGPLQSNWLAADLRLRSYCAYETIPLFGQLIVERQSATNLCTERLDPIDADHIAIVKPESTDSSSYRALKAAMNETRGPIDRSPTVPNTTKGPAHPRAPAEQKEKSDFSTDAFSDLTLRFHTAGETANRLLTCWKGIAGQNVGGITLQTDIQAALDGITPALSTGNAAIRNRDVSALHAALERLEEYNRILQNPNGRNGPC